MFTQSDKASKADELERVQLECLNEHKAMYERDGLDGLSYGILYNDIEMARQLCKKNHIDINIEMDDIFYLKVAYNIAPDVLDKTLSIFYDIMEELNNVYENKSTG